MEPRDSPHKQKSSARFDAAELFAVNRDNTGINT